MKPLRSHRGFTLIELVVALTIIAAASATALGLMSSISNRSALAMQREQAAGIASAYLQEILGRSFSSVPGGSSRQTFNDVADYNGLADAQPADHNGNAIAGLKGYGVTVQVIDVNFGSPSVPARRVTVNVTDPQGSVASISAFKTAP